jgi:hypothetical protein
MARVIEFVIGVHLRARAHHRGTACRAPMMGPCIVMSVPV